MDRMESRQSDGDLENLTGIGLSWGATFGSHTIIIQYVNKDPLVIYYILLVKHIVLRTMQVSIYIFTGEHLGVCQCRVHICPL